MTTKPFRKVIKNLTGHEVIPVRSPNEDQPVIIDILQRVAKKVSKDIKLNPIVRPRSNEVGYDAKKRVSNILEAEKAINTIPMSQNAGYPDFKICVASKIYFLTCKTFRPDQIKKSMRSFYCSDGPSIKAKVDCKAAHILMSFEMKNRNNRYTPLSYRLVDLYDLPCTLKKEWNSVNTELYAEDRILAENFV